MSSEFIEESTIYGCGTANLTASVNNGTLLLRQDAMNRDYHMQIQVSSLEGIERLEALLLVAKQQMLAARQPRQKRRTNRQAQRKRA
jgi:hypothetical protein